jgi:hypothetical protein
MALQIGAISNNQEDYGMYILYGLPQTPSTSENLLTEIDAEIVKLQTELISDKITKASKQVRESICKQ